MRRLKLNARSYVSQKFQSALVQDYKELYFRSESQVLQQAIFRLSTMVKGELDAGSLQRHYLSLTTVIN